MLLDSKISILFIGIVVSVCSIHRSDFESYQGFKFYETIPSSRIQADFLYNISFQNDGIDMFTLTKIPNTTALAMVSPGYQKNFENKLRFNGISYQIRRFNVPKTIFFGKFKNELQRSAQNDILKKYYRNSEIYTYLTGLEKKYPKRVTLEINYTTEYRPIVAIKITNKKINISRKKVIFIDAGIHAREWIAPATALYVIHQLVENIKENKNLLKRYEWVIIPLVNPDGYEYTHTNDRYWRKTRKRSSIQCYGTDVNRNFDYHWGEVGASSNPCEEDFKGHKPFSEPEARFIKNVLLKLGGRTRMYLSLHSFGRYLLYPWGYTSNLPKNWRDIEEVCNAGANAIQNVTGHIYTVGSSTNVLYAAAGGSDDYALGVVNIPIAITMELPPGGFGFDPDPSEIESMVTESWIGIKAMAEKVIEKY